MARTTLLIGLLSSVLFAACAAPEGEDVQPSDDALNAGASTEIGRGPGRDVVDQEVASLALDADGRMHVAFVNAASDLELVAERSDGTFASEIVDSGERVGIYAALAIDARGNEHIAYVDGTSSTLKVARRGGDGKFTIDVVGRGSRPTLAVEGTTEHVGFVRKFQASSGPASYGEQPMYSARAGDGAWTTPLPVDGEGEDPTLAIDASGAVSIAYRVRRAHGDFEVKVATKGQSGFTSTRLATGSHVSAPRLARGISGALHVAYTHEKPGSGRFDDRVVTHARRDPLGTWSPAESIERIDGYSLSVAVDDAGGVHILTGGNDGPELTEIVGRPGQALAAERSRLQGTHPSLALDSRGRAAFAFRSPHGSVFHVARER